VNLTVRPARPADADLAVAMLRASMGGLANYLFDGARRPMNEYLSGMYTLSGHRFSWSYSHVGENQGEAVGLLLCYPGRDLGRLQLAFLRRFPSRFGWADTLRLVLRSLPLLNAPEALADEYYVSNLSVRPELRRRSFGAQLMSFAEQQARKAGLSKCALAVDIANRDAIRLYERLGYTIVFTMHFKGRLAQKESGYHRMVKHLSAN
jgi:ribosomal protein S18 acetylase RimI-like enzyme